MVSKTDVTEAYIALAKLAGAVTCLNKFYTEKYWIAGDFKWIELAPGLYAMEKQQVLFAWFNHAGKTYAIEVAKVGCLPSSLTEESSNV